jgi:excinuclease ABC subunit A
MDRPAPRHGSGKAAPQAAPAGTAGRFVRVRGAREHNLQNIDVDIPRDALVVFSGVSGSGKSSLAFGTLYAEAQRRYFESVAPYARRLIDQVGVPDVDAIEGLPPAVALQQQRGTPGARSSVGSVTTLSSFVRMLYSRAGSYPPRQPMLYAEDFSPNTPQGACPHCHGLGHVFEVTEKLMVPDDSLTIRERAVAAWPPAWHGQNLRDILVTLGYDVDTPWRDLPKKDRHWILFTEEQPTVPVYPGFTPAETRTALRRKTEPAYQGTFTGARKYVLHTFATTQSALMKRRVSRFMAGSLCPVCEGKRLKREALSVTFAGLDIGSFSQMPLDRLAGVLEPVAAGRFEGADARAKPARAGLSRDAARKDTARAWPPAARPTKAPATCGARPTCRKKNASPPSASRRTCWRASPPCASWAWVTFRWTAARPPCHPASCSACAWPRRSAPTCSAWSMCWTNPRPACTPPTARRCWLALDQLRRSGNSLFVVEHDLDMMRRADWLVDVGPLAGERGGHILYSGPPAGLQGNPDSQTARYLFAEASPQARVPRTPSGWLELHGITRNNLHGAGRVLSARGADRRDRRVGLGQIQPGQPGAGGTGLRAPGP